MPKPLKTLELRPKRPQRKKSRSAQIGPKETRGAFWQYCIQTGYAVRARAAKGEFACAIDKHSVDALLVDQEWRCAVSGVLLHPPKTGDGYRCNPFGPSLDRIKPALGYVPGNVRIVCNIVNMAMNEWGLENLMIVFDAMLAKRWRVSP